MVIKNSDNTTRRDPLPVGDSIGLNVRVRLWLKARGFAETTIDRRSGEDVPLVPSLHGRRQVWTIEYSEWICARWIEWAEALGYKAREGGESGHRMALRDGHTDAEFNAWLIAQQEP